MMQDLESKLDELLVKKAPYQIPKEGREGIVRAMPWITVVGGVLMLVAAWTVWSLLSMTSIGPMVATSLGVAYGLSNAVPAFTPLVWLGLILLIVEAIIFFTAYPSLGMRKKHAWNLLYYVVLLNLVEAVIQFVGYTNVATLIGSLIASLVGLYILFQIRGYYTVDAPPATGGQTPEPPKK